jgi:assimilatory nitrate reductase catalytic subunit
VAGVWGVPEASLPRAGVPAVELLGLLGGAVKALFVHGSNLVVSAPHATGVRDRLAALDLLVVCDVVPSETTQLADVVLPVTQWAEEEGTTTSLEGRVLRRRRAVDAPAGVRDELAVLAEIARRVGSPVPFATEAHEVFDELARASAGGRADYAGLSHGALDDEETARHWPVPVGSTGTPRPFAEAFAHPDGRARMVAVTPSADVVAPLGRRETHLVTGRVLAQYQSGAQTRRVAALVRSSPGAFVEMHPRTAARFGVEDGDEVTVTSERGTATAPARVTRSIRPDTVFMPFHWAGEASANRVTDDRTDPVSGMPEFKLTTVTLVAGDAATREEEIA